MKKAKNRQKAKKTNLAGSANKMAKLKIRPTGDRVLIKESLFDAQEKTQSGIIIPSTVEKDSGAKRGLVLAVGPGKYDDGELIPVSVKEGDTVLFQWGEKIVEDGEEYYIVKDGEIMAIIK